MKSSVCELIERLYNKFDAMEKAILRGDHYIQMVCRQDAEMLFHMLFSTVASNQALSTRQYLNIMNSVIGDMTDLFPIDIPF